LDVIITVSGVIAKAFPGSTAAKPKAAARYFLNRVISDVTSFRTLYYNIKAFEQVKARGNLRNQIGLRLTPMV